MYLNHLPFTILLLLLLAVLTVVYVMIRKVLGRHLAEKVQENSVLRDELNSLIPGLDDGTVLACRINRKDLVMLFDPDKIQLAGIPTHRWTYDTFRPILHSDCMNVFEMWIFHYTKLHNPVERRLRFHLTFDQGRSYHWWELIYKLDEHNSHDIWFDALFVNIDKVKEMENAIEDAQEKVYKVELQEALLATINHDLRTPLNAVAGFSTLLAEQFDDFTDEERQEFSQIVCSNSDSMLRLIDTLHSMSEEEIAERSYREMPKAVTELLGFCYSTNKIICPDHLAFRLELPDDAAGKYINIDTMRIERVINNFVSNAFKFTPVGEVTLGCRYLADTDQVEIYVRDSGIGISPENQKKVFDEFIKLNEHAHGTGLGLNICRKIVQKHGGEIGLNSELGKGSTFYCRFKTVEKAS